MLWHVPKISSRLWQDCVGAPQTHIFQDAVFGEAPMQVGNKLLRWTGMSGGIHWNTQMALVLPTASLKKLAS